MKHTSMPHEWFAAFLPFTLVAKWALFTNLKASIDNAGEEGGPYAGEYTSFSPQEIQRHLAIYILQGISPSLQVQFKFKSQKVDDVNGCDFISRNLGPGAERRHKMFRRFFAVQDIRRQTPPRKEKPNHKVDPFLKWIREISKKAWDLGRNFSVDKQTQGMQGRHPDKLRITYKKEGDGFQCDALCDDGYTFTFFFCHEPPPKEYTNRGLSALHARVLKLFDGVEDKHHTCDVDNLYILAKFCKDAYQHPKSILLYGVSRTHGRGLPTFVVQEEVKNKTEQLKVRTNNVFIIYHDYYSSTLYF